MPSPRVLLATLLTVLQLILSVDAKGGGKGSGSKGSKTTKPRPKPNLLEEEKCYNAQHVQVPCPRKHNRTGLIVGLIVGVVAVILVIALAIWYFKRRSHKKGGKGLDDASSDRESILPLVHGGPGEKFGAYDDPYTDKSAHV